MTEDNDYDVLVGGGGPAGLSAGIFTARAVLETLLVNDGDPILRRNAHLENYPGFPAGVNSHRLIDMMEAQADRAGCERQENRVTDLNEPQMGRVQDGHPVRPSLTATAVRRCSHPPDQQMAVDAPAQPRSVLLWRYALQ